jgi:anti-sigma regulatory factor (Ser/Thr protein kinase)
MIEELTLSMRNNMEDVARVIGVCNDFLEPRSLPPRTVYAFNLVLEEILTNIVKYAFEDTRDHDITVWIGMGEAELLVRCTDDGMEFNPALAPPPEFKCNIMDSKEGGLGLHLVRQSVDSMEYCRVAGKNVLCVGFKLAGLRS